MLVRPYHCSRKYGSSAAFYSKSDSMLQTLVAYCYDEDCRDVIVELVPEHLSIYGWIDIASMKNSRPSTFVPSPEVWMYVYESQTGELDCSIVSGDEVVLTTTMTDQHMVRVQASMRHVSRVIGYYRSKTARMEGKMFIDVRRALDLFDPSVTIDSVDELLEYTEDNNLVRRVEALANICHVPVEDVLNSTDLHILESATGGTLTLFETPHIPPVFNHMNRQVKVYDIRPTALVCLSRDIKLRKLAIVLPLRLTYALLYSDKVPESMRVEFEANLKRALDMVKTIEYTDGILTSRDSEVMLEGSVDLLLNTCDSEYEFKF